MIKIKRFCIFVISVFAFMLINSSCSSNKMPYTIENNKVYFGYYPQSVVKLISKEGLSSITFDSSTWTSYKYYISSEQSDYMYYKDIDTNNDGIFDYRGVYFNQYRPYHFLLDSSSSDSCQDDNGYLTNTIYWFRYEPIEWDILSEEDSKVLIISNLILDSQEYSFTPTYTQAFGKEYSNDYAGSNIRVFLNDIFYNTAFNDLQKNLIEKIEIDNSESSTLSSPNYYTCINTKDKIFLLSCKEDKTYVPGYSKGTDYAKCQGLQSAFWWLRSPSNSNPGKAFGINYNGSVFSEYVEKTCYGMRPACWIKLKD